MRRIAVIFLLLALPAAAVAQEDDGGIDVVDVSGPLDSSALEFVADAIEEASQAGQELVVVQVNSKAVLDADGFARLEEIIGDPPLPTAVWVGPAPAAAYGGAARLVEDAEHAAIAPGAELGRFQPNVLGVDTAQTDEVFTAEESGLPLQATLRQYLQDLDGVTFTTADGPVTVSTVRDFEGGVTLKETTFKKPGLITRFFRLAVTPEAAFFFLVVGLSIVTFEFFALGPGVAAGVAAVSLLLAGWGVVNLPVRWWALALAIAGWGLLTASYQKGGMLLLTVAGTVALQLGGMWLVGGGGQIDPRWWLVLPSVLAVLFFFLIAMPTVQRARLSTQTIGRDSMIGMAGTAISGFDPDGVVEVNGARWRATAHREAGIEEGSEIVVAGVDGLYLEVDLPVTGRET